MESLAPTDSTLTRALNDAERASLAAAREAFERGEIDQTEVAPGSGVWKLKPTEPTITRDGAH